MVNIVDDTEPIDISVLGQYQNFVNYEEYDPVPPDYYAVSQYAITMTDIRRDACTYVRRTGSFGDFSLVMKITVNNLDTNPCTTCPPDGGENGGTFCAAMFTRKETTHCIELAMPAPGDGLALFIREYTQNEAGVMNSYFLVTLKTYDYVGGSSVPGTEWGGLMPWASWPFGTPRWVRLQRTGTTVTAQIYSDEALTQLLKTLTRTVANAAPYNYFLATCGRGGGGAHEYTASAVLENYYFE